MVNRNNQELGQDLVSVANEIVRERLIADYFIAKQAAKVCGCFECKRQEGIAFNRMLNEKVTRVVG